MIILNTHDSAEKAKWSYYINTLKKQYVYIQQEPKDAHDL